MIEFISDGVNINVPYYYAIWMLKCSELNSFLSEVLSFIIIINLFNVDINITIKIKKH